MAVYRNYVHKDFSYLISCNDNNKPIIENTEKSNCINYNYDAEFDYKKIREDKLSNQRLKYAFSKDSLIYHDKECPWVKKISNKNFEMTKEFSDEYNWCPECYRAAIIRYGIQNDPHLFERYYDFFKFAKANKNVLHYLIVEHKAKLWIVSSSLMEFKVNEDRWRVSVRNNKLTLLHNNYHIDKSGKRIFEKTFHSQLENIISFRLCAEYMVDYTWERHLEGKKKKEEANKERAHRTEIMNRFTENIFIENYLPVKNHYLFHDKFVYLDCDNYFADDYFIKYGVRIKFLEEYVVPNSKFRWIVCKIPKKYSTQFSKAMRKTVRKMYSAGKYEYFDLLNSFICFD